MYGCLVAAVDRSLQLLCKPSSSQCVLSYPLLGDLLLGDCRGRGVGQVGALLQGAAELALMLSAASSGIMGISVAVVELKRGA